MVITNCYRLSAVFLFLIGLLYFFCTPVDQGDETPLLPDSTASLSVLQLSVNGLAVNTDPAFHPETVGYTVQFDDTISILQIEPSLASDKATLSVMLDGESIQPVAWDSEIPLYSVKYSSENSTRVLSVTVTAEDGATETTYTLNITWQVPDEPPVPETNAKLAGMDIIARSAADSAVISSVGIQPVFHADTQKYDLLIDSMTMVEVHVTPASEKAAVTLALDGGAAVAGNMTDGALSFVLEHLPENRMQQIVVTVTAEDGVTKRLYTIDVAYETDTVVPPDTTARLNLLQVVSRTAADVDDIAEVALTPLFNADLLNYSLVVDTSVVLGVLPVTESTGSTLSVELDGSSVDREAWSNGESYYTCGFVQGTVDRQFSINVVAEDGVHKRTYFIDIEYTTDTLDTLFKTPDSTTELEDIVLESYDTRDPDQPIETVLKPGFHPDTLNYALESLLDSTTVVRVCPKAQFPDARVTATINGLPTSFTFDGEKTCYSCSYESGRKERTMKISVTAADSLSVRTYAILFAYKTDPVDIPDGRECLLKDMPVVSSLRTIFYGRGGGSSSVHDPGVTSSMMMYPTDSLDYVLKRYYQQYMYIGINPIPYNGNGTVSVQLNGDPVKSRVWSDDNEYYTCTLQIDEDHPSPQEEHFRITHTSEACDTPTIYNFKILYEVYAPDTGNPDEGEPVSIKVLR